MMTLMISIGMMMILFMKLNTMKKIVRNPMNGKKEPMVMRQKKMINKRR